MCVAYNDYLRDGEPCRGNKRGGWESLAVAVPDTSRREVTRLIYLRQNEKIALHPHPRVTGVNGKIS